MLDPSPYVGSCLQGVTGASLGELEGCQAPELIHKRAAAVVPPGSSQCSTAVRIRAPLIWYMPATGRAFSFKGSARKAVCCRPPTHDKANGTRIIWGRVRQQAMGRFPFKVEVADRVRCCLRKRATGRGACQCHAASNTLRSYSAQRQQAVGGNTLVRHDAEQLAGWQAGVFHQHLEIVTSRKPFAQLP